jgi:Ser-tRNA(Ala) deacylase AlaX
MVFQCQRESFLKEFTTTVESVKKADDGSIEVTFKDTVFFPEGEDFLSERHLEWMS